MDYQAARKTMVEGQVRPHDVTDLGIQQALGDVPREIFLPSGLRDQAYVDAEITYAEGRALLTARDFAKLLTAVHPAPTDLVLDIACGSGYSTAVLANLAEMVVAVENDEALAAAAPENWEKIEIANAAVVAGKPAGGAPGHGPFDVIFIGAAVETVPPILLEQLKDGGRLGAIVRGDRVARGVVYTNSGGKVSAREVFDSSAQQILPGFEAPRSFQF